MADDVTPSASKHTGGARLSGGRGVRSGALVRPGAATAARKAVALAELIVGLALAGGVALALGHMVTQVSRNVTSLEQRAQRQTEGALALLRLRSELRQAIGVSALSGRRIAFTHPDVTGDGLPDTLTYDWDGTAGSVLTREINAGGADTLAEQCQNFIVTGLTRLPAGDELLTGHVGYGPGVVASTGDFTVSSTSRGAQIFTPTRTGAFACSVTQVRFYVRPLNTMGSLIVSLHQTAANAPGLVIESVSRPLSQISAGSGWETFRFSGSNSLTVGVAYAIMLRCSTAGGGVAVAVDQITQDVPLTSPDFYRFSTDSGSTWQPISGLTARDLKYMVYGRWLNSGGSPLTISTPHLTGVQIRLETGTSASPVRFESAAQCVNLPEQVQ